MVKKCWWLFVLLVFLSAGKVEAVSLSPPFKEIVLKQGTEQESFELVLQNNNKILEAFELSVVDFGSLDETGGVAFLTVDKDKTEKKYALASWISLEKDSVMVGPGKSEKIKITILNKDSLTAGGHYGAVMATVKSEGELDGDKVGLKQTLASLIYVLKSGGEKYGLEFKSLKINRTPLLMPTSLSLRFENNGNIHLIPRGKVEVVNNNKVKAVGIVNESSGRILPESFRVFEVPVNVIKRWNWPGFYSLKVSYRYDGKDDFKVFTTSYWYFGWEGVTMVFIGLLIGIILMLSIVKKKPERR